MNATSTQRALSSKLSEEESGAATMRHRELVLRPATMPRSFLFIADEEAQKPRQFLDAIVEQNCEPPSVSLKSIFGVIWATWRGQNPRKRVSL